MTQEELPKEESKKFLIKIIDDIVTNCNKCRESGADITDIGDSIGRAIGSNVYKECKKINIWGFERGDFESGLSHGFSLYDGSH